MQGIRSMTTSNSRNDRSTTSGSNRMKNAVNMAKSQPRRTAPTPAPAAQPSNNQSSGQLDPNWQRKISGSKLQPSSFRPTSTGGGRIENSFASSSIGNTNRRRPGQPAPPAFDAKAFLRQQQRGQFLRSTTTTSATPTQKGQVSQQPMRKQTQPQFSPASDPAKFDIEKYKASTPKRTITSQNSLATNQNVTPVTKPVKPVAAQPASSNDDDDNDNQPSLPWQTATRNVAARANKATSSKDVLQQLAAMRAAKPTQQSASLSQRQSTPLENAVAAVDEIQAEKERAHEQVD